MSERVDRLIAEAVVEDTQARAFRELEALGTDAVPYLIGRLDDRRSLPVREMALVNKSTNAFEAARLYHPQLLHDALAAILNQLTGQRFEFVYNGASAEIRDKNVAAWRAWCVSSFPNMGPVCNGAI